MRPRLVLLRHGRTAWNAEGRFQGHTDVELDDVGRQQAAAVAPVLAALPPARIWSSDLARASATAGVVGRASGVEVVLDDRLREYDVGVRAGLTADELREQHPHQYAAWAHGGTGIIDGAEEHELVRERVVAAFHDYWTALGDQDTGIVVMHGAALRTGLTAFLGWDPESRATLRPVSNCGWVELVAGEDDRPQLAAYNRVVAPVGS